MNYPRKVDPSKTNTTITRVLGGSKHRLLLSKMRYDPYSERWNKSNNYKKKKANSRSRKDAIRKLVEQMNTKRDLYKEEESLYGIVRL